MADLRIADLGGGVGQQRRVGADQLRRGQLGVPGGRADDQVVAVGG